MICQVLLCSKQESKDHVGTLCKYHAEKLEHKTTWHEDDPFTYKTINKKNCVWENGCEHVRAIPTKMINAWIKNAKNKKKTLEAMIELIQEQIKETDEEIEDNQKTKNSRYVKN